MKNLTWLEIDLGNFKENISNLKSLLKPATKFMTVVKADAYGHGLIECSRAAISVGADWLGVINLAEAMTLRKNGIFKPILILSDIPNEDFRTAANQDINVAIISLEKARQVAEINFDKPLKVHLKIDTGLNRLGIENEEIVEMVKILSSHKNIIISGIYSHFSSVEENNLNYTKKQIENFKVAVKTLKKNVKVEFLSHIASSAATLTIKDSHFDMVRCGIATYGLWPSKENQETFGRPDFLKPVLTYKTQIIQIKNILKAEKIGYGCSFEAKEKMVVAIIPVGYYEGLDRKLSNCGEVLVGGKRCSIIGRICMNMAIIDISQCEKSIKAGDEVVIIGRQGNNEITVDEIAEKLGTINYEITTRLPGHLKRIYKD